MPVNKGGRRDTPRGPNTFKQTDAARALRAAKAAGFKNPRLEITAGKISVVMMASGRPRRRHVKMRK